MTTFIAIAWPVTVSAGIIFGALCYRNNAKKFEKTKAAIQALPADVKNILTQKGINL